MNKPNLRPFLLILATLALAANPQIAAAGDRADSGIQTELKSAPYEKREDFIAAVKESTTRLDARIADLQARQADKPGNEARARAQEALKAARADLEDRISAFGNASVETWNTVRDQALSSLTRVHSALEALQSH